MNANPDGARHETSSVEADVPATELERLRAALRHAEDLIDIAPAFFGFLSLDGAVTSCNRLALEAIEATADEVYGQLFWEAPWWRALPRSASTVREAVAQAAAGQAAQFDVEYWSIQGGVGKKRWVALAIRPLLDAGGRVNRISATGVDITEQQGGQEALRRSEDRLWQAIEASEVANTSRERALQRAEQARLRLTRLFETAPAFVCGLQGPEHVFDLVNAKYQRLLGAHRELLGRRVRDAIPEAVEQGFIGLLDGVYQGGRPFIGHETPIKLDREGTGKLEEAFLNFVYQPRQDEEGRVVGIDVFGFDVTEHVRVRKEAQAASEANRVLAAAIPQQVWTATADGALDFVNDRVLHYFNASREEVLGAGWQSVIHPEDLPRCLELWAGALKTGEEYEVEFRLRRFDGTFRWHLGRALPLRDTEGRILKWFGTNTDIDEARKTREELRRRTEFEQLLLGMVSHDLRNPLNAIQLGAHVVASYENLDARAAKSVTRIQAAAARATRMISDLMDFTTSRLGPGISIKPADADMHALGKKVADEILSLHPDRELIVTHSGDGHGRWDADRLTQVLENLLINAVHYSPAESKIRLTTSGEGETVSVSVQNDGPPINPEVLPTIFQPLKRGPKAFEKSSRSIGMGLYIVQEIVTRHGGTVAVRSDAETGTTFAVHLPRAASSPEGGGVAS
jgi:PAS domain S-box-containing protein